MHEFVIAKPTFGGTSGILLGHTAIHLHREGESIGRVRGDGDLECDVELRLELHTRINDLGIGAQGLGGLATVLDVKVATAPCHAATIPVALLPNCAATRYLRFVLDGSGPAAFEPTLQSQWDGIADHFDTPDAIRVDLDKLDSAEVASWRTGQTLLLWGRVLTARDAAHKRLVDLLDRQQPLPVDFRDERSTTSVRSTPSRAKP